MGRRAGPGSVPSGGLTSQPVDSATNSPDMSRDLSLHHGPITDLFRSSPDADDPAAFRLTDEQVSHFRTNGYVSGIRLLNERQIETLRADLEQFFDPDHEGRALWYEYHSNESGDPNNVLFHALGAWRITPAFHDLLWHLTLAVPAAQLLGASVRFWHDQLFCKPAHHGGVVAWHQDYSYWTRTRPMRHLTCWIGLDDATVDNGCLHYVPRSHEWELLPVTGLARDMDAIQTVLTEEQKRNFNPVPIELKAGEASFHHPHLVHGSFGNRTARPRRAVVLNVFADGVASDSDEPLLSGVPPVPSGEKMEGQFFPLLYEAPLSPEDAR